MIDMPATPRFGLPLLALAQAQKEVTHNEALTLLDALICATVEDGPLSVPPMAPGEGQCWIVGAAPAGAWAEQEAAMALYTSGGWRFLAPREGMQVARLTDGARLRFQGGSWSGPTTLAPPSGGTVVDVEARAALTTLILSLEAQGLMISG